MEIREGRVSDCIAAARLLLVLTGEYPSVPAVSKAMMRIANMVASPEHFVIVADSGEDGVVGIILGTRNDRGLSAWGLVVAEAYRHKGIGKQLIDALCALAERLGCKTIRCRTEVESKGYYERIGGRIVAYEYEMEVRHGIGS